MNKKLNACVVGAGGMGRPHTRGWKSNGMNVISLVDIDEEKAGKLADEYDVPKVYTDYKKALKDPEVDVVSVCTPLKFHAPVTIFAAEQGKHVICEKPLCQSRKQALAMEEAVNKAGVNFATAFQRSRTDDIKLINKWVKEEKFGTPVVVDLTYRLKHRPKLAMHDAEGNMGVAMDRACHDYIAWQNILGSKVSRVFATGKILQKDNPYYKSIDKMAWDTIFAVMEYESGAMMNFTMSWGMEEETTLRGEWQYMYGPKGGLQLDPRKKIIVHQGGNIETIEFEREDYVAKEIGVLIDSINEGKPAPVGIQDGKDALAVALSIFESIETGKVVNVEHF